MSNHGGSLGIIVTFWPRFQVRKRTRHLCWTSGKVKCRDLVVPLWKVSLITVIGSYPSDLCSQKVVNSFYFIFIEKEGKRRGKLSGNIFPLTMNFKETQLPEAREPDNSKEICVWRSLFCSKGYQRLQNTKIEIVVFLDGAQVIRRALKQVFYKCHISSSAMH